MYASSEKNRSGRGGGNPLPDRKGRGLSGNEVFIRMFQPDGVGELWLDDGRVLLPNDLYLLEKETFRMYYTSHCTDQQVIDVYIEDNHGQVVQKTFSFQNDKGEEEDLQTGTE